MVITVSSIKGGVGKSSVVILLANNLASRGHKVLVIDMDLNNSATLYYTAGLKDAETISERQNIMIALTQGRAEENIVKTKKENVFLIPSSLSLCDIRAIDFRVLKRTISNLEYDYVLIDTSPTYDNLVISSIYAADLVLSPVQFTKFNYNMTVFLMSKIMEEIPEAYEHTYILYNHWKQHHEKYTSGLQSDGKQIYDETFDNVLDVKLPDTPFVDHYTQEDVRLCVTSRDVGNSRLALGINSLVNQITGEESIVEVF
ncbi:MAG: ParA family protein [Treponema sp.]|nr:ParA family protein [Treponema sp.]